VGTSYQTLLVTAPIDRIATAVARLGIEAVLLPAGPDRTAVIPRGGDGDYADAHGLAQQITAGHGFAALSQALVDSDVLIMHAHRSGEPVHRYVSRPAMLAQAFEEPDGTFSFHLDGVTYADGQPIPNDPIGADPTLLAPPTCPARYTSAPTNTNMSIRTGGACQSRSRSRFPSEQTPPTPPRSWPTL
jgi:hypothetical protein